MSPLDRLRFWAAASLLLALLACGPGGIGSSGSNSTSLGNGLLFTAWNDAGPSSTGEIFHLLVVVPSLHGERTFQMTSWGGTADLMSFDIAIGRAGLVPALSSQIEYELEFVDNKVIRADGREFDLLEGNLLACVLSESGAAQVVQLPERIVDRVGAAELLRIFQDGLGPDHPAQMVVLDE